jgi:hypothetical protein
MHRIRWIVIVVIVLLSLTFLFPAQNSKDQDDEQMKKIIKKACKDDYVIDLSGLEELKNLKIRLKNLECLEALKELDTELDEGLNCLKRLCNLNITIDLDQLLESLESLECLEELEDFDCHLEVLEALESLEALKVLDDLHIDIDWDDFEIDMDDFDFDWDFEFDFDDFDEDNEES